MMTLCRVSLVWLFLSSMLNCAARALPLRSRRSVLISSAAAAAAAATPTLALDMDAFVQQELSKDSVKATLSEDAALCKYGVPSPATGEACVRAGLPTTRLAAGVDAFGKADRGNYVRCKQFYADDGHGKYVKQTTCDGPR